MVKPIKPVITILKNDEYQLLIIGGTLLAFLMIILFFSKYYYKKQYNISKVFDSQNGKENPLITQGGLNKCTKGECVVEISTGLKKCPVNKDTVLFYDLKTQTCTNSNSCPPEVPYPINSDGSVNKLSKCTTDRCNCTSEITCPMYNSSKFSIVNGSLFSSYASDKNFIFEQVPLSLENNYQGKIQIDPSREYCRLNSTYSSTLVGGCSFTNQINDFLMDCSKEELSETISSSPYSLDPYYLSSSGLETKQYCEVDPYIDSNWNNMTLCINQNPCKLGNFTYNYDKKRPIKSKNPSVNTGKGPVNSRDFCQSYASNLDTYLTDLQYYTLSCIGGTTCNQLPNQEDIEKFYSSQNQELDISVLNASYDVKYKDGFFIPNNDITYSTNPFINNIRSGDMIKIKNNYFVLRVISDNTIEVFKLNKNGSYELCEDDIDEADDIIYFPQYALNGFNYNTTSYSYPDKTIISFKISNLGNAAPPNATIPGQNYYIPSYSISQYYTFFRSGLAKPVGYVFKQEVQEVRVLEDLTQQFNPSPGFNASNYKIKQTSFDTSYYNDISMYSPVWNNDYGRSECIRCSPLLVASINMKQLSSSGSQSGFSYDAVTIQLSGKDFGHYRKNFQISNGDQNFNESLWCYESKSKINIAKTSTPNVIYLERPNTNINIGDYILSTKSEFNFTIKQIGNKDYPELVGQSCIIFIGDYYESLKGIKMYTPFFDNKGDNLPDSFYGLGVDNNTYQEFEYGVFIHSIYQDDKTFRVSSLPNNIEPGKGFLFGNKYTAVFSKSNIDPFSNQSEIVSMNSLSTIAVSIIPSVQVLDIIDDSKIITSYGQPSVGKITKASSVNNINNNLFNKTSLSNNTLIQFISVDRNLYLNNNSSEINGDAIKGTGGTMHIEEITDGRISSIVVDNSGTGYTNISPIVRLKSYDHYLF